jgi:uncharacterized membrane protein YccC
MHAPHDFVRTRRASLRRLLAPARLRESFAVTSPPSLRNAALAGMQTSLAVLIAVAATHLSPWAHMEGFPALGALAALFGRFAPAGRRMSVVLLSGLLLAASVGALSLASIAGATPATMLICLALLAGVLTLLTNHWRLGAPGAVIFVFAACAAVGPVDAWRTVVERVLFTAAGVAVAWCICRATDRLRSDAPMAAAPGSERPLLHQWNAAGRIALCAASAALLALAAGWPHPAWAAIGATAVLQGSHLHITMHRAVQRTVGTVIGAALASGILASQPTFWPLLAAVIVLQFITELVIGFNYVFGLICVTPMALLMTSLAAPSVSGGMPMARVLDTVLGALVGIAFALVFSTLDDRSHLAAHHENARAG